MSRPHPPKQICKCGDEMARGAKLCHKCYKEATGAKYVPSPQERDKHPLCGAKRRNGEPCRMFAGQGTDHPGIGKCKHHMGNVPNHKKHAEAVQLKRDMVTLGVGIELDPAEALLFMNQAGAGHVKWLGEKIRELPEEELGTSYGEALTRLYSEERDRLARVAQASIQANAPRRKKEIDDESINFLRDTLKEAARVAGLKDDVHRDLIDAVLRKRIARRLGDTAAVAEHDAQVKELQAKIRAKDAEERQRIEDAAEAKHQKRYAELFPPEELIERPKRVIAHEEPAPKPEPPAPSPETRTNYRTDLPS